MPFQQPPAGDREQRAHHAGPACCVLNFPRPLLSACFSLHPSLPPSPSLAFNQRSQRSFDRHALSSGSLSCSLPRSYKDLHGALPCSPLWERFGPSLEPKRIRMHTYIHTYVHTYIHPQTLKPQGFRDIFAGTFCCARSSVSLRAASWRLISRSPGTVRS